MGIRQKVSAGVLAWLWDRAALAKAGYWVALAEVKAGSIKEVATCKDGIF
jgi:hypothetical protein